MEAKITHAQDTNTDPDAHTRKRYPLADSEGASTRSGDADDESAVPDEGGPGGGDADGAVFPGIPSWGRPG